MKNKESSKKQQPKILAWDLRAQRGVDEVGKFNPFQGTQKYLESARKFFAKRLKNSMPSIHKYFLALGYSYSMEGI